MAEFAIGEVAITRGFDEERKNGHEVTIEIGKRFYDKKGDYFYAISMKGNPCLTHKSGQWLIKPCNLRKKKPPRQQREIDTVVPWDTCPWSPYITAANY